MTSLKGENVVEMRKRTIPLSPAMLKKVTRMNVIVETLRDVAVQASVRYKSYQKDLQEYVLYCRDELDAHEDFYNLNRLDVGFELKEQEKEGLDGIH